MSEVNGKRTEDEFDFSAMSLDELLSSVHADLGDLPGDSAAAPAAVSSPAPTAIEEPAPRPAAVFAAERSTADKKPRAPRSRRTLLISAAAVLLLAAAAIALRFGYVSARERSLPESAVQSFLDAAGEDYWLEGIRSAAVVSVSEFEDSGTVIEKFLLSAIRGKEISFREYDGVYTDDAPVYILSADGTDFCLAELSAAEGGSAGFGFGLWQVSRVELLESFLSLETRTVELNVKEDATVVLNGITVGTEYALPDTDSYVADYRIEGIYDDYTLEVLDADGAAETPVSVSGDSYCFPVPGKSEFCFSIYAPDGAEVRVGGVTLGAESIVSTGVSYPVFDSAAELLELDGLDDDTAAALADALASQPTSTLYSYSVYDYERPDVTVTFANGCVREGSENSSGSYYFVPASDSEADGEAAKRAEEFIRLYVSLRAGNGEQAEVLGSYLVKGSGLYGSLADMADTPPFGDGTGVTYNYLELAELTSYGDVLTVCRVYFGLGCMDGTEIDCVYDLALVYINGTWRVAGMSAADDDAA